MLLHISLQPRPGIVTGNIAPSGSCEGPSVIHTPQNVYVHFYSSAVGRNIVSRYNLMSEFRFDVLKNLVQIENKTKAELHPWFVSLVSNVILTMIISNWNFMNLAIFLLNIILVSLL